jgi:DNA invertase Pin-like site-specific DNA recombinase
LKTLTLIGDLVNALDEFRSLGVAFVSMREQIDTTTPVGRVVFSTVAAMAEFEREILRERVRAGLARARERGVRLGRPRKVDPAMVRELRSRGLSYRAIAAKLGASSSSITNALRRSA